MFPLSQPDRITPPPQHTCQPATRNDTAVQNPLCHLDLSPGRADPCHQEPDRCDAEMILTLTNIRNTAGNVNGHTLRRCKHKLCRSGLHHLSDCDARHIPGDGKYARTVLRSLATLGMTSS